MFTVVVATLAVNIAANVVSPANDFANAFPKLISFRTGGLITGIVGILMQPWRLLADPSGYIFAWLVGYSGGLGSIAGVLIADYWLVRRKNLRWAISIDARATTSISVVGMCGQWLLLFWAACSPGVARFSAGSGLRFGCSINFTATRGLSALASPGPFIFS
jgi:cytosine/uracil/thiamine/allantoin permease